MSTEIPYTSFLPPGGASGKSPACQCRKHMRGRFNPCVRHIPWRRHGNPLQYSCQQNSMDRGVWRATVHVVTKTRTRVIDLHFHFSHIIIVSYIEEFHCLKNLLHRTHHLSFPGLLATTDFFFNCLYCFTFSSMSCSWTHTVCSLFRLASFT